MSILETVLSPIVWLMKYILEFYEYLFSSTGVSIFLLSLTFALLFYPLQRIAQRSERRINEKMKTVDLEVRALKGKLKGEMLFLATENIYQRHDYHPIQSIGMGTSFFVMLPILVSAIILFTGSDILANKSFLFIEDLSKPDSLLGAINVLPLIMTAITLVDAKIRFKNDRKSQYRFYFISFVLLMIVYNLASGLVFYWIGSNIMSILTSRLQSN